MTITATIIADSISPQGIRLTTFQLRYPRFIHAELMTHRDFSRNASSSRAIPVHRMIEDLRRDPAMPVFWGSNKPGMQAGDQLDGERLESVKAGWLQSMEQSIRVAETMIKLGLHKQIANRILEPWAHINVVCTSTNWANFYTLRRHADAQPEIKVLADAMYKAQENSDPVLMNRGQWHLPYVDQEGQSDDRDQIEDHITMNGTLHVVPTEEQILHYMKAISVARCARVSYLTHDGKPTTVEEDMKLFERLLGAQPLHASPAEHQATPDLYDNIHIGWINPAFHGNFHGWVQYRKTLRGERILD
jgi:hypothetical protein